jgi:hypothetical protein
MATTETKTESLFSAVLKDSTIYHTNSYVWEPTTAWFVCYKTHGIRAWYLDIIHSLLRIIYIKCCQINAWILLDNWMKFNVQAFKQHLHCWCPIVNRYCHIVPFIDIHLNSIYCPWWRYSKLNYGKMHLHIMVPKGMWQKLNYGKMHLHIMVPKCIWQNMVQSGIGGLMYQFCI